MDTSTHIVMGFTLGGLAFLDPIVSEQETFAQAVLIGTVIGSNAPDFDYGIKLVKGNGMYVEHHRGLSHSIPALFLWSLIITCVISLFYSFISVAHLFGWVFLSVVIHVGMDILNAYGTQAGRPFTKKWLSLNILPLFDPYLFFMHGIGLLLWILGGNPVSIFTTVYILTILYIFIRFIIQHKVKAQIHNQNIGIVRMALMPTMRFSVWNVAVETSSSFEVGQIKAQNITWIHLFQKPLRESETAQTARSDHNVRHFLANSDFTYLMEVETPSGFEVRLFDLRFRTGSHYPYMAVVRFSKEGKIQSSFTGWIHQMKEIPKRLERVKNMTIEQ